jgi:hypothetical protein
MDRISVCCSDVKSVGYEGRILELEFHNGSIFRYFSVSEDVYLGLISAPSKIAFFHRYINERYSTIKIS